MNFFLIMAFLISSTVQASDCCSLSVEAVEFSQNANTRNQAGDRKMVAKVTSCSGKTVVTPAQFKLSDAGQKGLSFVVSYDGPPADIEVWSPLFNGGKAKVVGNGALEKLVLQNASALRSTYFHIEADRCKIQADLKWDKFTPLAQGGFFSPPPSPAPDPNVTCTFSIRSGAVPQRTPASAYESAIRRSTIDVRISKNNPPTQIKTLNLRDPLREDLVLAIYSAPSCGPIKFQTNAAEGGSDLVFPTSGPRRVHLKDEEVKALRQTPYTIEVQGHRLEGVIEWIPYRTLIRSFSPQPGEAPFQIITGATELPPGQYGLVSLELFSEQDPRFKPVYRCVSGASQNLILSRTNCGNQNPIGYIADQIINGANLEILVCKKNQQIFGKSYEQVIYLGNPRGQKEAYALEQLAKPMQCEKLGYSPGEVLYGSHE